MAANAFNVRIFRCPKRSQPKLNRYKLKSYDAIDKACSAILKRNHTKTFFNYRIINEPVTT